MKVWLDALHRDDWALPSGLCSANGSDVAQRFGIYRNNVLSACTQALADTFPVCQALVGEAFFSGLALAFAQQHLPRTRRMADACDRTHARITTTGELRWVSPAKICSAPVAPHSSR